MTEFADFPMRDEVAEYPSHREMKRYFQDFAEHFDLCKYYNFGAEVLSCTPLGHLGERWRITWRDDAGEYVEDFSGVLIANGTLSAPNMPTFKGVFDGELIHSFQYRHASQFDGKRVLIVGAGNSGCDIAVDAIHMLFPPICLCGVGITLCLNMRLANRPIPWAGRSNCLWRSSGLWMRRS
ncbi:NAD(P)-binding domain-containing protein [Sulfitobacter sp.]|uniref:NAD(P)-binding domain-containing protein n=1 Tax=Sulfitobacter sp. TaxID=1903071 RepID=UPI003002AE04